MGGVVELRTSNILRERECYTVHKRQRPGFAATGPDMGTTSTALRRLAAFGLATGAW